MTFITFEGGEGAGKTTLIEKIKTYLTNKNLQVILTREPGGTVFSEHVRDLLLEEKKDIKISSKAELCLFLASRAQHIKEVINPALKENKIVLCDRFNDSSIVYQGFARNLGIDEVIKFSSFIVEDFIPCLTLYLDIDPKIGLSRVNTKYDRIESLGLEFHKKIREGFLLLQEKFPNRIKTIDSSLSKEAIFKKAIEYIDDILKKNLS
ncbi:MAG: Thymidylate kinase [Candidatus Anoxychlamydiales bacterium]|nr:Thymidylate kinase [Candidatus Anoxychlamydiales bacterium]